MSYHRQTYIEQFQLMGEAADLRLRRLWLLRNNRTFLKELHIIQEETGHKIPPEYIPYDYEVIVDAENDRRIKLRALRRALPPFTSLQWKYVEGFRESAAGSRFITTYDLWPPQELFGDLAKLRAQSSKGGWGKGTADFWRDAWWFELREFVNLSYHEIVQLTIKRYPLFIDQQALNWWFKNYPEEKAKVWRAAKVDAALNDQHLRNRILVSLGCLSVGKGKGACGFTEEFPPVDGGDDEIREGREFYVHPLQNDAKFPSEMFEKVECRQVDPKFRQQFLDIRNDYIARGSISPAGAMIRQAIKRMRRRIDQITEMET